MSRIPYDELAVLEAAALIETKALASSGRRRTDAEMPVFRLRGPLLAEAEYFSVNYYFGFKKWTPVAVEIDSDEGLSG